jgi:hypothetical protein
MRQLRIFHKYLFHYFEDSFNDETNLVLRYASILAWLVPLWLKRNLLSILNDYSHLVFCFKMLILLALSLL